MAKPTVKLYNITEGKLCDYEVEVDTNGEIVATYKDDFLKFPGGLTRAQFDKYIEKHNKANSEVVPLTEEELKAQEERDAKNSKLLDSLS